MKPHEYDDLLRRLTAQVVKLDERDEHILMLIEEQRAFNRQQVAVNERLTAAIERLDVPQARIETLLARRMRQGENGREA